MDSSEGRKQQKKTLGMGLDGSNGQEEIQENLNKEK